MHVHAHVYVFENRGCDKKKKKIFFGSFLSARSAHLVLYENKRFRFVSETVCELNRATCHRPEGAQRFHLQLKLWSVCESLNNFTCFFHLVLCVQMPSATPGTETGAVRWPSRSKSVPSSTGPVRCLLTERTPAGLGLDPHTCPCRGEQHQNCLVFQR